MARTSNKRERLLDAAKELIHHQGYHQTSLADIARASDVPLGNVYYYYKTKEDIGNAVIEDRLQNLRTWFDELAQQPDPLKRLLGFLDMPLRLQDVVAKYGCPVGSLCQELNKEATHLSQHADSMIQLQLEWLTQQFRELKRRDARDLALQLLSTLQGASLLASSLHDPAISTLR